MSSEAACHIIFSLTMKLCVKMSLSEQKKKQVDIEHFCSDHNLYMGV